MQITGASCDTFASAACTTRLNMLSIGLVAGLGLFPLIFGIMWFFSDMITAGGGTMQFLISLFCGVCVAAGCKVLWAVLCHAGTVIGTTTISRPGLFGRHTIAWRDIDHIAFAGESACGLYAGNKGMLIHLVFFANREEVANHLRSRAGNAASRGK